MKNKALVVTSRNVHYSIVLPVIEELQRKNWNVQILRFERIWENAESFLSKTARKRSLESFYVKPVSRGPNRTKWYVYNVISKLIFHATNVLKLKKPNIIIVMTDSTPPCRIAVLVGRLANIPTLLLLHAGMIGRNYDCPRFLVDKIAVTGEFAKEVLTRCGVDENKLIVTGRPSYDALVRATKQFVKEDICKKLNLDSTRKTIVYTTENLPPRESEATTHAICKAIKEFSGLQFVIKVHPSELDLSVYKRVTKDVGIDALITRQANIYEVLYVCDLVITGFSATALDAMILGKSVITVNFTGLEDPLPFAGSGAALGVCEENDLVEAIENGLYNEEINEGLRKAREKFIYEHAYRLDGKSTERVVKLIERVVGEQRRQG